MDGVREGSFLILGLNWFESRLLLRVLGDIESNYQINPEELDEKVRGVWYSSRGCETAGMSGEEAREWRAGLHGFKQANLDLVRRLKEQLKQGKKGGRKLRLRLEEAPHLLTVVNDHRLFLAARHDIGQHEMDLHRLDQFSSLPPPRQAALYEVHLLAYVMEEILSLLNPGESP